MLGSRLDEDAKAFARISHAIRSQTSETDWFRVDSTNLDLLAKSALPPIAAQIDNYLNWLADQVGDDRLAPVKIANDMDLSGVVGLLDLSRLGDLEAHMVAEDLIVYGPADYVRLTPKGWDRIHVPRRLHLPIPRRLAHRHNLLPSKFAIVPSAQPRDAPR